MSSRALYWLGKIVVESALLVVGFMFVAIGYATDEGWPLTFAGFLFVFMGTRGADKALAKLKAEANRDTRLGLNGPARQEDLL